MPKKFFGKSAYAQGQQDYHNGFDSDDCPFNSDAEAAQWENGFWAEEAKGPDEAALDRRYGRDLGGSLF